MSNDKYPNRATRQTVNLIMLAILLGVLLGSAGCFAWGAIDGWLFAAMTTMAEFGGFVPLAVVVFGGAVGAIVAARLTFLLWSKFDKNVEAVE